MPFGGVIAIDVVVVVVVSADAAVIAAKIARITASRITADR